MSLPWPNLTTEQWRERLAEAAKKSKAFDPNEPRDDHGQWTSGGGSGGHAPGSSGDGGGNRATGMHQMFDRVSKPDGGFTYQPTTGDEPAKGFAVSIYPERSFGVDAENFKFDDLVSYAAKNRDLFDKTDHYIGAWHDPASHRVFLDVSVVSSSAREAEKLALGHDQIAYFDLAGGKSVTVNPDATSGGAKGHGRQGTASAARRRGQEPHGGAPGGPVRAPHGQEADGAGAPGSPREARQLLQRRVTLTPDELRTAALIGALVPGIARDFDPDEPRDDHGQWTTGGGGTGGGSAASGGGGAGTGGGSASAALPKRVDPSVIPRAEKLTDAQREIETKFAEQLAADPQAAWDQYRALPETKNGKILSTDSARELSPAYVADRSQSAAVHEPASWFVKQAYAQELAKPPRPGENPEVLFMAGGTGAGKTTAIRSGDASVLGRAQIIYDSNFADMDSNRAKVDQAVAAGKHVLVANVDRDPLTAFTAGIFPDGPQGRGVLTRAMRTGRTVPLEEHINTHVRSRSTVPELEKAYAGDNRVSFRYIDNNGSGAKSASRVSSFAALPKPDYNSLRGNLYAALERAHNENRISDAVYHGTLHAVGP